MHPAIGWWVREVGAASSGAETAAKEGRFIEGFAQFFRHGTYRLGEFGHGFRLVCAIALDGSLLVAMS